MACEFDRTDKLLDQGNVTGIDYIYVNVNQTTLKVHFHMKRVAPPALPGNILNGLTKEQIVIYPDKLDTSQENIPVANMQWIQGDTVLELETEYPGGFANYKMFINDDRIDPKFNHVLFSFKANCESNLDCKPPEHECPEESEVNFPVNYRARDFWSFRRALLDFVSLRYPDWQDRLEADGGIMLAEIMSALGDEFSYYQDRIAREAYFETATQRRSIRHHARLVDYEIHDGLAASTFLDITVKDTQSGNIDAGVDVWAEADGGRIVSFEIGRGLKDILNKEKFFVDSKVNSFLPHTWGEDDTCLPVGATEAYINGWHKAELPFNDTTKDDEPCRWMLLQTNPTDPAIPRRRLLVCVIEITEEEDPLVDAPTTTCDSSVTRLVWQKEQALPFEMDLTIFEVRGNLVPATAGRYDERLFVAGANIDDLLPTLPADEKALVTRTVERVGTDNSIMHLFSIPSSDETALCWLGKEARTAIPEVKVWEVEWDGAQWQDVASGEWDWRRSLLGEFASQENDEHFTLEDGMWRRVAGYRSTGEVIVHIDYAGEDGKTIRFGDNQFGRVPDNQVFKTAYRLGNGRVSNVAADTIVHFDTTAMAMVSSITNPLPAKNGTDPETAEEIKQIAPEAFRVITYRAVREEDYREAAERLDWVQLAGARSRWTGSWMTTFVIPDPLGAVTLSETRREELATQIDRFRQAGRQAFVADPRYADIDLIITICVQPYAYPGQVQARVLKALVGKGKNPPPFFSSDNFTFGTPLHRSQLEAFVQEIPGVRGVGLIQIRHRGHFDWKPLTGSYYPVDDQRVIRLENDRNYPERGTLKLIMEGGA